MYYSKLTRGFYPADMQANYEAAGTWPTDAVELLEGEEAVIRAGLAAGSIITGKPGAWVVTPVLKSSAELKALQLDIINAAYSATIGSIKAGIPADEVLSWGKQDTEARAWYANSMAETPMVDALAAARGIPKGELVTRIIIKADAFAQFLGVMTGRRQKLEDALNALPEDATAADVDAISW